MAEQKKKVLVVGAGAAGMAAADTLAQHPDRFDVTLIDAVDYCGGQAFSIPIDKERHGASWLNQGVQGGSYIYHHSFKMFEKQGHVSTPVKLQVSFGKDETFWTNVFPTKLVEKHRSEIKRFHRALKIVHYTELLWIYIPIKVFGKMFFLSDDFLNFMILPTIALFLGTGNATPDVSSLVMERLFTSPTFGMWYPGDPESLISNHPPMVVFPEFSKFYGDWKADLESKGVKVRLSTELDHVVSRDKKSVKVAIRPRRPIEDGHNPNGADQDLPLGEEEYDELILCVLADTAKGILGKQARWIEKRVLGGANFSDDITVTHWDSDYMKKYYENAYNEKEAVQNLHGRDETARIETGRNEFKPMYYIRQQKEDPRKLDMCFDCTNYQAQFPTDVPFDRHIFQTIFLNKKDKHLWTMDEINPDKIIRKDWWHQLCHRFTLYALVVPWMWLLNGRKRTTYAAAWTLVNAHEVAIISGMAAAYRLGAAYPKDLEEDSFALLCFRLYLLLSHGTWYRKGSHGQSLVHQD